MDDYGWGRRRLMLTELRIRDLAIIEDVRLSLAPGFTVLTGETGAGKSIIVGALGLLLGERASADLVRGGATRARVEAAFDASAHRNLLADLDERGIDASDGTVILSREIAGSQGGRSRAWINGSPVTAAILGEVARALVNLHGQHESQNLLQVGVQRALLDAFGGASETAARVRALFRELDDVRREVESLEQRRRDAERRADYLRHVAEEIDAARLTPGEDQSLEDESRRLNNVEELRRHAAGVIAALDGPDAALVRLGQARRELQALARLDSSLGALQEQLETAAYAVDELRREMEHYETGISADPERLREVQERRDVLFRLSRKYGPSIEQVLATAAEARTELSLVDSAHHDIAELRGREAELARELTSAAAQLTALRQSSAQRLARAVDALLPGLGMADGKFTVDFLRREAIGPDGGEDVIFQVALNVGHDPRPLARVASGGELSRVMLALTTILAQLAGVPTLVFDEVDSGIGGRVALQVGDTMRRVAAHHQVVAITHLPQIASRAHNHVVVEKSAQRGATTADVHTVTDEDRVAELARMLGGDAERDVSRAHARELLAAVERRPAEPARARRTRA
ncbi:MAG TPA: DNA repair protein RecN [Gemmatimonadaceae bacterium]|nr:DNA repair protein RecN [Gemmatimonadaceae bacterium]